MPHVGATRDVQQAQSTVNNIFNAQQYSDGHLICPLLVIRSEGVVRAPDLRLTGHPADLYRNIVCGHLSAHIWRDRRPQGQCSMPRSRNTPQTHSLRYLQVQKVAYTARHVRHPTVPGRRGESGLRAHAVVHGDGGARRAAGDRARVRTHEPRALSFEVSASVLALCRVTETPNPLPRRAGPMEIEIEIEIDEIWMR